MTDPTPRQRRPAAVAALAAALLVGLAACGDDPFDFDWTNTPGVRDTVLLYSLARPELGLASGFSFVPRPGAAVVEAPNATGTWDIALDTQGGALVLLPPGALGVTSRARILPLGPIAFDDVVDAPEDTTYYTANDPVDLALGSVYIVRSNRAAGSFGSSCVYYAKMEPLALDAVGGTMTFRYVASPICNSRELTPPD